MIHIQKFIDKMSAMESRQNKDVVIPIAEARGLRDDIARLLVDLHKLNDLSTRHGKSDESVKIEITGGSFK